MLNTRINPDAMNMDIVTHEDDSFVFTHFRRIEEPMAEVIRFAMPQAPDLSGFVEVDDADLPFK